LCTLVNEFLGRCLFDESSLCKLARVNVGVDFMDQFYPEFSAEILKRCHFKTMQLFPEIFQFSVQIFSPAL
jgi:hypothetical protein